MEVITAPNLISIFHDPRIFLAGGITNCACWQDEIIQKLSPRVFPNSNPVLLNPRRRNFPIDNPNAAKEQIEWEYYALNQCHIFSMWFCAGESVQPICMYELGRQLALRSRRPATVVLGVEEGYKHSNDVYIQTELVNKNIARRISNNLEQHAENILKAIEKYLVT